MSNINNVAATIYASVKTTCSFGAVYDALANWRSVAGIQERMVKFINGCDWQNAPVSRIVDTEGNLRVGAFMGTRWNDTKEVVESWWMLTNNSANASNAKIKAGILIIRDDGTTQTIPLNYLTNTINNIDSINACILDRWALSIGKTRIENDEERLNYVNDFLKK